MFKFLFVCFTTLLLVCFIVQDPLITYLEYKYNKDFYLKNLSQNAFFKNGDEFYRFLNLHFGNKKKEHIEYKDEEKQKQEIVNTENKIEEKQVDEPKNFGNLEISFDKNSSLVTTDKKIKLKSGDEVLFIGDSIMQNIAIGSRKIFAKEGVKVIDISKHSTGLINKKYYDWQKVSQEAIKNNKKIKLIVALFGANDSWGRTIGGKYREFNTAEWIEFYKKRVYEIYEIARDGNIDVLWLGVPCMKKDEFDQKMTALNEIFYSSSKKFDEIYVDTNEIICQDKTYTTHIKDDNKSIKVRANDGIHLSIDGGKIIAKRILKEIDIDENSSK